MVILTTYINLKIIDQLCHGVNFIVSRFLVFVFEIALSLETFLSY